MTWCSFACAAVLSVAFHAPSFAQSASSPGVTAINDSADYLQNLRECREKSDSAERLACFDATVTNMLDANEKGDVRVVNREDVRDTRRKLFGFSIPDLGILGGSDDEASDDELFQTTIENVRYSGSRTARFTTAEGAVWEIKNIPRRMRPIDPGDSVEFKKASFGYYFVRVSGQRGIKGRRVR